MRTPWYSPDYKDHYRIGGLKLTLDGSPQGRTAWRTIPYLIPPDGPEGGIQGISRHPGRQEGPGHRRHRLRQQLAVADARQRRRRHRPVDQRASAGHREVRQRRPAERAHPRTVHPRGPAGHPGADEGHPLPLPHAHLLLGRLVPEDRRRFGRHADQPDQFSREARDDAHQPHRRAGGTPQPDGRHVGHREPGRRAAAPSSAPTSASRRIRHCRR